MNDMNVLCLVGRLTMDEEVSYTQSGTPVGKMAIAVNRSVKRGDKWEDEVSFFDFTLFGKSAEGLKPYLTKGKQIAVNGRIQQERWTDKETGKHRSKIGIVADNVQLLGGKGDGNNSQPAQAQPAPSAGFKEDIPYGEPSDIPF